MSTTIDFLTVTNSIAALAISGVTHKDADEIPESIGLDYGVLAPVPDGFVSNVSFVRDELTGQKQTLTYTLMYRYYHCRVSGGLYAAYSGLIQAMQTILIAFTSDATLTGALDNEMPEIVNVGTISDPSGNMYYAFDILLHVKQFVEV